MRRSCSSPVIAPKRRAIILSVLAAMSTVSSLALSTTASAQTVERPAFDFDLPSQQLDKSVTDVAEKANMQVLYQGDGPRDIQVRALNGRMTVDQALAFLLSGTGYTFRYTGPGVITLTTSNGGSGTSDGERVLGAVRVEGSQGYGLSGATSVNGINGSRDVTATEGTGSYTTGAMTIGSKTAASIKEVPASVSVLTNAQMQDQNITGIKSAMEKLPGVISQLGGDSAHPQFYSRGFQITTFQIDGGAGLKTTGNTANRNVGGGGNFVPQMDMSLYDHVEIIRGAAGTFNGFGDPGGVINLVRKKPLDHNQLQVEGQLGSFDLQRVSVDLTGPLGFDGALRGRIVATHQSNDFFYDIVHQNKNIIYATLEADVSPTTLLSIGGSYDQQDGGIWQSGLMRFTDGRPLLLSRSVCLCLPWAHFDTKTVEGFAQIDQKIGPRWVFRYKVTYQKQVQDRKAPFLDSMANPNDTPPLVNLSYVSSPTLHSQPRRWLQEATFDGSFRLFGQEQKIVLGGNIALIDGKGNKEYQPNPFAGGYFLQANPLAFNPYDPQWADPGIAFLVQNSLFDAEKNITAFARFDFMPVAKLHLLTGVNYTHSSYKARYYRACRPSQVTSGANGCTTVGEPYPNGLLSSNYEIGGSSNISWPPSVSLRYDASNDLSLYGTYSDIYLDQSSYLTRERNPLQPITGANFEGGLKWAPGGNLNINMSGYYIRQRNFQTEDCHMDGDPNWIPDGTPVCENFDFGQGNSTSSLTACCYKDNPNLEKISYGIDLEISGRIRKNWQIAASYTYNKSIVRGPGQFDALTGERNPLLSFSPRNLYKLWSSYEFSEGGPLKGLALNVGAQGQSMTFVSTSYCPVSIPAGSFCPVDWVPVHFTDPGHIIISVGGSYKISDNLTLQANVENLLDKTYFAQVGSLVDGNWYGSPRSFVVTLRGKW
jgi:outer-membrane receptor for ferric coprogen and ferric-rhodotorulic acid